MSEFIGNFHFLRPWWLLAAILPIWVYWKYYQGIKNQSSWEKVCDKNLLDFLLVRGSSKQRKAIGYLALGGMLAAVVAAAGPSWKKTAVPAFMPENPVMILLNVSSDMEETDLSPNRLGRAKFKIDDLLGMLTSSQAGLIVYSSEPFLITPITDVQLVENLLPEISRDIMPENGDRPDRAINLAVEKLQNAGYREGNIVIFAPDAGQGFDQALEAAQNARKRNYIVNTVNISTVPAEKLKLIAQSGGGIYLEATPGDRDIKQLAGKINQGIRQFKLSENLRAQWLDYGYYLVLVPLLCCLYFFRRGIIWGLAVFALAAPAEAGFFLNSNQEGLQAFNRQDYQTAEQKFTNPQWKAASQYRQGNYEAALQNFGREQNPTALYNQGNALAKSGKVEEAIKKYEEVLKIVPDHEDAKFNLEYLKKQQQQQNQNQNNNSRQDKQNQEQQQSQGKPEGSDQDQDQQNQNQNSTREQPDNNNQGQQNSGREQEKPEEEQNDRQSGEQQRQAGGDEQEQGQQPQPAQPTEQEGEKFDEKAQARALQYRDIPENPGGLLKAFIYKEYMKKRYEK